MTTKWIFALATVLTVGGCQKQPAGSAERARTVAAACAAGKELGADCKTTETDAEREQREAKLARDLGHSTRKADKSIKF